MKKLLIILIFLFTPFFTFAATPILTITPENPIQGEPVIIKIENLSDISKISKITFDKKILKPFLFKNIVTALYGVDLNFKSGEYSLIVELLDGTKIEKKITIGTLKKYEEPLGIPEKLGGNSTTSQTNLVNTLAIENAQLASLTTGKKSFWTNNFIYPILKPIVTDNYGYTRITGQYSITHKGVDFRADESTKVTAINRGVVRLVKTFRNYGKTVVVDHGLGVMSFYMHLSKINVNQGELVLPGQLIGYAGQTGYAEQPHLHLTIRINNISIDPIKFFNLFK
ncbi:MAG: peptidoglycan DD-metalloendopeptidase family protein [Candidatus Pacebacteria bacterium]|nr:peptidoglycan DD-metalloendopeptidase family protein [Candidatus Paceibacterota bacterium]